MEQNFSNVHSNKKIAAIWLGAVVILFSISLLLYNTNKDKEEAVPAKSEDQERETIVLEGMIWEPDDDDLYWTMIQDMLSGMILENERIEFGMREEAHELFSEKWYKGSRLTDPYLYVYICVCNLNDDGQEAEALQDTTFSKVDGQRRAGEYNGKFLFCSWVKKTEQGVEIGTDFSQKLFRHILWECSMEYYKENGSYLIGLFPSEQLMEWCPLYNLLGESMVMVSDTDEEDLEKIFEEACEKMHTRQSIVSGDLSQNVRFGESFNTYQYNTYHQELAGEDFEVIDYGQYMTYCSEQADVDGYLKWLDKYEIYYPEYRLDFHTGYDTGKKEIFQMMCNDRDNCHTDYFAAIAEEYYTEHGAASAIEYDKNYKNTDYAVYVYDADFDGDNEQEAFVVIGMAEEETAETVFGELLFIQDQNTVQWMEGEVFIQKDQTYVEQVKPALFHFSYIDGITHENKVYDMQAKEEEKPYSSYVEKEIAGEEFVPWEDLLERIRRAEENEIKPDYEMRVYYHDIFRGVGCLDSTEHFSLYILGWGLLIKTAEDEYIYGDIDCMSDYSVSPELIETDIDGDGEMELAMITFVQYGTGFHVEDLYIVDKTKEQGWKIYHLLMSQYKPALEGHFCTVNKDGVVRLSFEGKEVGQSYEIPPEDMEYPHNFEINSIIEFFFTPAGKVILDATVEGVSEACPIGFGAGHGLMTEVLFKDGKFELSDVTYRNTDIDYQISTGVPAWLGGYAEQHPTCFWEEIDQEQVADIDIIGKKISYVEIRYPAEQVESGNVKAEVTIWFEGNDETIDYEVWMVYGTRKDGRKNWFIKSIKKITD